MSASPLGFCSSVELSYFFLFSSVLFFLFFIILIFLTYYIFSTFIPLFAFPTVPFPLQLIFNVYKSSSTSLNLHIYAFFSFFPFLSTYLFCFHIFIHHLAPCFSFVFQFVLYLVLFLTGKYNFYFLVH